jgi:hypothetical protein
VTVEDDDDQAVPPGRQRKIIHVDMDAFYASVEQRDKRPIAAIEDAPKRHFTLFAGAEAKLPIKRVIVGPSKRQAENVEFAQSVVGCEVVLSKPRP